MKKTTKPFWEDSYKRPGRLDTFGGGQPEKDVVEISGRMKPGLNALDLGCGEGRNALYLASKGFNTTAVDISISGIQKLNDLAGKNNVNIDAFVCDMREYSFNKAFDLIVCSGCLHLIKREEWQQVLKKMKDATVTGGYNLIGIFTDAEPEPEDQRGLMVGLFKEGELFTYYQDWEIIESRTFSLEHQHPDGPKHKHSGNNIVARKK